MEAKAGKIKSIQGGAAVKEAKRGETAKRGEIPAAQKHHFDFPLFIVLMLICAFGLVMLFSASYYDAQSTHNDGLYFVKKQLIFFGIGLAALLILSHIKYTVYQKVIFFGYLALIALLVLTLLIGEERNNAKRWINLGGFDLQPSELAKFVLVVLAADIMTKKRNKMGSFLHGVLPLLIYMVIPCALIVKQPNFSMVIILGVTMFIMLYLGGAKAWHLLVMIVGGVIAIFLVIKVLGYSHPLKRLNTFFDPWSSSSGDGYQVVQSLYAFGNGGLFGQGINYSRQKLLFLPELQNDFILPIIGEELGFFGCLGLLAAYMFVIYRGIRIAMRCRERFGSLTAAGITCILAIQVIVNVAVVTGSIPATGQTLPFVSSGGTSMIVFMAAMGILLNVSRYTEVRSEQ